MTRQRGSRSALQGGGGRSTCRRHAGAGAPAPGARCCAPGARCGPAADTPRTPVPAAAARGRTALLPRSPQSAHQHCKQPGWPQTNRHPPPRVLLKVSKESASFFQSNFILQIISVAPFMSYPNKTIIPQELHTLRKKKITFKEKCNIRPNVQYYVVAKGWMFFSKIPVCITP